MSEEIEREIPLDMAVLEQVEANRIFIQNLESNQLDKTNVQSFSTDFCRNKIWIHREDTVDLKELQLEELLLAILKYCQNETLWNTELFEQLLKSFSLILSTLVDWNKRNGSKETNEVKYCIQELFQKAIIEVFKNNVNFEFGKDSESVDLLKLSQIKITNDVKVFMAKLLNMLVAMVNKLEATLFASPEVNVILLFMMFKMNELLSQQKHKILCITLYTNIVEYFQESLQDKVILHYLNLLLFQNTINVNVEMKLSIITFLFERIVTYYSLPERKFMVVCPCDYFETLDLKSFHNKLKDYSIEYITSPNPSIRKSALYVLKRMYHLECDGDTDMDYTWKSFFHIFETLEETQLKLIVPVLEDVVSVENLKLQQILLKRMFQYDNPTITRIAIEQLHLLHKDPNMLASMLDILVKALNNSNLFVPESEVVRNNLVKLFELFNKPYSGNVYYLTLLNAITSVAWGPVPLFYVIHYLDLASHAINPEFTYTKRNLPELSSNFKTVTKLLQMNYRHNQIIRSATDSCLRNHILSSLILPLKHMNIVVDDKDLVEVLNQFLNACRPPDEEIYSTLLEKLFADLSSSLSFNKEFMYEYIKEHFIIDNQVQRSSFNIIALFLCTKSGKIEPNEFFSLINDKMECIAQSFENIVQMKAFAVRYPFLSPLIWCNVYHLTLEKDCCFLHSFLTSAYSEDQFQAHLTMIMDQEDLETYGEDIEFLVKNSQIAHTFLERHLLGDTLDLSKQNFGYFRTEYNYLFMFNRFYSSYSCDEYFVKNENQLQTLFAKDKFFECENRKSVALKLKMFVRLCQGRENIPRILVDLFILSELCIESLSNTSRDCLKEILEIMEILTPHCANEDFNNKRGEINEIITKFIKMSYQEVKHTRRTTLFHSNMIAWVYAILPVLEHYDNVLMECVEDMMDHEESMHCLLKRVSNNICYSIKRHKRHPFPVACFLMRLIGKGLVYGELPKRDILIERTVCDSIREHKMGTHYHVKFHYSGQIRYKCTLAMLFFIGVLGHEAAGLVLLNDLKETFDADHVPVQYFHNSQTHRMKQRALQSILLLDHLLSNGKETNEEIIPVKKDLFTWGLENILNYNHQPSIRYYLEWLIINNMECSDCTHQFWVYFDRAYDERPGSIVSFLCIVFHVVQRIITSEGPYTPAQIHITDQSLERIISCSMSQLFNLRLYANVVFMKLYEALGTEWTELSDKYRMVYNAMLRTKNSAKGNAILNAEKLTADFYFTRFSPFSHFSLETIFYDLPRLADVAYDEWGPWGVSLGEARADSVVGDVVRVSNEKGNGLGDVDKPEWIVTSLSRQEDQTNSTSQEASSTRPSTSVSQKKFIPWKPPCPSVAPGDPSPSIPSSCSSDLIIVTSLIDKIPNIGGLSRSCEVFGASLVVDNLELLKDPDFKALSMTSEKHVNIIEVKKYNLKQYLKYMRCEEGYQLIGAEQTNNSDKLQDFKYPKKTILVLGNEREGIVSDILVLLDSYVEIPQLGVLRSLNVHVTGALFVWEYVKQHCLENTGRQT
uniref:Probable methyltransferase TARBP1 n=1 Tax=Cacopsylla melanoneura TaxID=428564 RepID=A0A8D8UJA8_9HEMI